MMNNKRLLTIIILIVGMLCLLIPQTAVFAQDPVNSNGNGTHVATKAQLKLVQQIYGDDITYGEFLQTVFPDELNNILTNMSSDMSHPLLESKMQWPRLPDPSEINLDKEKAYSNAASGIPISSQNNSLDDINIILTYVDWNEVDPVVTTGCILHAGSIWTQYPPYPMTSLSVFSWLYYLSGQDWFIADLAYNSNYGQTSCYAYDNYYTTSDNYYYTAGTFAFVSPPGGDPAQGGDTVTNSPVYCTP